MSPIEKKLIEALREFAGAHDARLDDHTDHDVELNLSDLLCPRQVDVNIEGERYGEGKDWYGLYARVPLLTYRLDLLLVFTFGVLCIECDGHDWHDRTKQQAAYDRSRDRELLRRGCPTIRFTGSEIFHSAERCAAEVFAVAAALDAASQLQFDGLVASRERELARSPMAARPKADL